MASLRTRLWQFGHFERQRSNPGEFSVHTELFWFRSILGESVEEEEGIKSAFELAMERISGLPKLTPEEKAEQKEREYAPIGTSIAVKYMDGALADSELPIQL